MREASVKPWILSTCDYPERQHWVECAERVDATSPVTMARRLIARASAYECLVLVGSSRTEQLASIALHRLRPGVTRVLEDCTWGRGSNRTDRVLTAAGARTMDGPEAHYCVFTAEEQRMFPGTWGVAADRVHHTPWYHGLTDAELRLPTRDGGYVFAGGDSLRDYRPLIEAARELPEVPVRVGAYEPPPVPRASLPANLEYGPMSGSDYATAMRNASVVVVALKANTRRSAGQNNYLNPMALGKLVIVADAVGVREYLEDRRTALIVEPGNPRALAEALRWALNPENRAEVAAIAEQGRAEVLRRFTPDAYVESLLRVAERACGHQDSPRHPPGGPPPQG